MHSCYLITTPERFVFIINFTFLFNTLLEESKLLPFLNEVNPLLSTVKVGDA